MGRNMKKKGKKYIEVLRLISSDKFVKGVGDCSKEDLENLIKECLDRKYMEVSRSEENRFDCRFIGEGARIVSGNVSAAFSARSFNTLLLMGCAHAIVEMFPEIKDEYEIGRRAAALYLIMEKIFGKNPAMNILLNTIKCADDLDEPGDPHIMYGG